MVRYYGVLYVALVCLVVGSARGQFEDFLSAFPHADVKALYNANEADLISHERVVEAQPPLMACDAVPIPPPTDDINQLKPGHIKVVSSMGDSITAAMSAKDTNILLLRQYRGISYACGGDPGAITMPNLLQQFTAKGYPIGVSTGILDRPFNLNITRNGLNGAVSGAIFQDLVGQAKWLVNAMKNHTNIDMANDWKVHTMWIGSNNLCRVCNNNTYNGGDAYEANVMAALEILYANIPRLFVNLLPNLDVTRIYAIKDGACGTLHPVECPCATSNNANDRALVSATVKDYIGRISKIQATFKARNNKQFAIAIQPFLIDSPIYNRTFLSAADCFHPAPIGHQAMGTALWNSMITPSASKKMSWDPSELPLCATAETMIHTD